MTSGLVVVGFDGTPAAERAVRAAAELFAGRKALVVTVWEAGRAFDLALIPARGYELPLSAIDVRAAEQLDQAMYREAQQLANWGARLAGDHGLDAEGLAVADELNPADTLVRVAKEHEAQVMVVGGHQHGRLAELIFGSTTRGVLRHAHCPVLVAQDSAHDSAQESAQDE
jgi:nucleotide-binding universal stress UspA family protein